MNGQQQLDANILIEEYKIRVSDLTHDVLILKTMIRQLEQQLQQLQSKQQEETQDNSI